MKKNITQQKVNEKGILDIAESKIKLHKKEIVLAICVVILVAIASGVVSHYKGKAYQKQWGELFLAELPIALQQDADNIDLSKLEVYAAANEATPAGAYAALMLGNAYYQMKNFEKAELYFKQALKSGGSDLQSIAQTSLIATYIAQEAYVKAIEQAGSFEAKYPGHFATAQVKTHKALALELSGKPQEAKAVYMELIQNYPSSYSSAVAELQSNKIK